MKERYINEEQERELKKFYQNILSKEKKRGGICSSFWKKEQKNKQAFFQEYAISLSELTISAEDRDDLIENGILKVINEHDELVSITYKGLVLAEYGLLVKYPQFYDFLDDLDVEFFEKPMKIGNKPLTGREKILILSIIGLGSLSQVYPLEVTKNSQEAFKDAVDLVKDFFLSLGDDYADDSIGELWNSNIIGEGPILAEIRRNNDIPKKTENIFYKNKGQQYVSLLDDGVLNSRAALYIFRKLFDKRQLNFDERRSLIATLDEVQKRSLALFSGPAPYDKIQVRRDLMRIIEDQI